MSSTPGLTRVLDFPQERSVAAILAVFRRGSGDPTTRFIPGGPRWVAWPTPLGPVTARFTQVTERRVEVTAWGPGAQWLAEQSLDLLGGSDDVSGFTPRHPLVAEAWRRIPGWRVPRSGLVVHALVPAIIEQKVTGQEAFGGQRRLVHRFGSVAPGPGAVLGLKVAPDASGWARIPSWEWLRARVDTGRADTVQRAMVSPGRLEECVGLPLESARRRLRAVPGIGVWTSSEVLHRALGDADAVSFGDYHVAKNIGWALTGEEIDDDALAELLEPYRGHRYRVQRLLELAGATRPRRGARMSPRTHLPG
ncbi:MAG: DNA-3-methyladenine glycosylase 2 family protein [Actinomycetia bacterium]|nr:DNA-3-methyladenine glycosylase 2 family protein [Actinomycetes bacterium]